MTIGWWIMFGLMIIFGLLFTFALLFNRSVVGSIVTLAVTIIISLGIYLLGNWYCSSTAGGIRDMKDQQSNFNNGILREVTVTAEDGREIYHYKGRVDIETDPKNKYILFETEEGMRHMIYYGVTDTVLILEVEE